MKRTLFVLVFLASILLLTACGTAPVHVQPVQVEVVVNQNQNVNIEPGCSTCATPAVESTKAPEPTVVSTVKVETGTLDCGAPIPDGIVEPFQAKDMRDSICYPYALKAKDQVGNWYCVGLAWNATLPTGWDQIEITEQKNPQGDGNYLHGTPWADFTGFSMADYCGGNLPTDHLAPEGTTWQTGLVEKEGFKPFEFPLE